MLRSRICLAFFASVSMAFGASGTAQAGDVFKGTATGPVAFLDGAGPGQGFWTTDATGQLTHMGKSLVMMEMHPAKQPKDGTIGKGFVGRAALVAANGDELDMFIATESPTVTTSPDGSQATAVFHGVSQMVGGTGRFSDASLASDITITIKCDFRRLSWTITIAW